MMQPWISASQQLLKQMCLMLLKLSILGNPQLGLSYCTYPP